MIQRILNVARLRMCSFVDLVQMKGKGQNLCFLLSMSIWLVCSSFFYYSFYLLSSNSRFVTFTTVVHAVSALFSHNPPHNKNDVRPPPATSFSLKLQQKITFKPVLVFHSKLAENKWKAADAAKICKIINIYYPRNTNSEWYSGCV